MSDYRGELYRKIILDFYKQKHRPPYVEELKSLGVKELYFRKKYGSYPNYIRNELRLPITQTFARDRIVVDKTTNEVVFEGTIFEINEFFFTNELAVTRHTLDFYLNKKAFRRYWYIFAKMNYHVWVASDCDFKQYRRAMYFLFRKKCYPNNMLYAKNGEVAQLKRLGEQLDKGEIQLSDVLDVEKYKEFIGKDIDYYEVV